MVNLFRILEVEHSKVGFLCAQIQIHSYFFRKFFFREWFLYTVGAPPRLTANLKGFQYLPTKVFQELHASIRWTFHS